MGCADARRIWALAKRCTIILSDAVISASRVPLISGFYRSHDPYICRDLRARRGSAATIEFAAAATVTKAARAASVLTQFFARKDIVQR